MDTEVKSDMQTPGVSELDINVLDKMIIGELAYNSESKDTSVSFDDNKTAICRIVKRPDYQGYGFNVVSVNMSPKRVQRISRIKGGSPVEAAGLPLWSRIVEINGVNVEDDSHDKVIGRISASGKEIKLLIAKCNVPVT